MTSWKVLKWITTLNPLHKGRSGDAAQNTAHLNPENTWTYCMVFIHIQRTYCCQWNGWKWQISMVTETKHSGNAERKQEKTFWECRASEDIPSFPLLAPSIFPECFLLFFQIFPVFPTGSAFPGCSFSGTPDIPSFHQFHIPRIFFPCVPRHPVSPHWLHPYSQNVFFYFSGHLQFQ